MDITDVYGTFHPNTKEYTVFSAVHGTFSKINHILGHKTSLRKYKKTKITSCILYDHRRVQLDANYSINFRKYTVALLTIIF